VDPVTLGKVANEVEGSRPEDRKLGVTLIIPLLAAYIWWSLHYRPTLAAYCEIFQHLYMVCYTLNV